MDESMRDRTITSFYLRMKKLRTSIFSKANISFEELMMPSVGGRTVIHSTHRRI